MKNCGTRIISTTPYVLCFVSPEKNSPYSGRKTGNGILNRLPIKNIKLQDSGHPSSQWIVNNEFESQPVKLRIEPLMSVKPFNDPANVVLADFSQPGEFNNEGSAEGVSGGIKTSTEKSKGGGISRPLFCQYIRDISQGWFMDQNGEKI